MDSKNVPPLKCDFCGRDYAQAVPINESGKCMYCCHRWWCRFKLMLVQWAHWRIHTP